MGRQVIVETCSIHIGVEHVDETPGYLITTFISVSGTNPHDSVVVKAPLDASADGLNAAIVDQVKRAAAEMTGDTIDSVVFQPFYAARGK
jgi:hypothetical protein